MRYRLFIFSVLAVIFGLGCGGDGKKDIRDYYFPMKSLYEGLVYEYQPVAVDSLTPIYWYYRTLEQDGDIFFTGTYYEYDFIPLQFTREEVVSNGMVLEDIYLFETDSTGKQNRVPVEILSGSIFPFMVSDSGGIFLYKVKWTSLSNPASTTTLIKNRRYVGDTTYVYKEAEYPAVIFEVKELFENEDKEEGFFEHQFDGMQIYAKGIGLVYYKKKISEGLQLEYALHDRYPMETLEEKFREFMDDQNSNDSNDEL